MLGKINQRLKARQYSEFDGDVSANNPAEGAINRGLADSFSSSRDEAGSLGSAIEMSAAVGAGVVPDGTLGVYFVYLFMVIVDFMSADTFTVDQAVNAMGFGSFQVKLSLITGLSWMADSMEMMILSIISPALKCDWRLPDWKLALITTVRKMINTFNPTSLSIFWFLGSIPRHDGQCSVLGAAQRQIWTENSESSKLCSGMKSLT